MCFIPVVVHIVQHRILNRVASRTVDSPELPPDKSGEPVLIAWE